MARAESTPFERDCAKLEGKFSDSVRLTKLIDRVWAYQMTEYPEFATSVGYPGQDRKWTDRSLAAYARRRRELDAPLKVLRKIKRPNLKPNEALNYDLMRRTFEENKVGAKFPEELLPVSQMWGVQNEIPQTIAIMPKGTVKEYENILARLEAIPGVLDQTQALLAEGIRLKITGPSIAMEKVVAQLDGLLEKDPKKSPLLGPFQNFPESLRADDRSRLAARAAAILEKSVLPALQRFRDFFAKTYLPACRKTIAWKDLPQGPDWYAFKVKQSTTTELSPQEIHDIGLKEVARILKAMEAVKEKAGFIGDLEAFNDFLRKDARFFFKTEEELVAGYRELAKKIDPGLPVLFGKLPRLTYGVLPIPAYAAPSQPTAYYQPGSPTAGRAGNFFANTYDLKARPKWEMEALTLHEAVPGHHLQIALAQEMQGVPEFRKHEGYNAYVEGWALYAESLGPDLGLYRDPYSDFGRLTYEMWRSIRLVVDTGIHSMGWSREKAIEYFRSKAGKAEHDIVQEVDRYLVMPGQALGYKIGHLRILELRAKAEKKLGEKFSVRAFHDAILENGALPLDILETRMEHWASTVKRGKASAVN